MGTLDMYPVTIADMLGPPMLEVNGEKHAIDLFKIWYKTLRLNRASPSIDMSKLNLQLCLDSSDKPVKTNPTKKHRSSNSSNPVTGYVVKEALKI
ncbi:hypothetical protein F441_03451 [Phytophthora nicotianae CJ01A1]|uniref:Uncharacterized protein n=3 Tax=Phytophthora nicotianae TaxID=4792 RepID=V9FQ47_PHYNI|nr:hypothetical protein F443_03465 [Phytophthora nicotianae P1569]ETL31455.1 hypothetical protein L916_15772 [Phytophthora nicotianae]ETM00018.1 hypothetical protein L917_03229 [Phytophthora nicotianae]ETM37854.1 hypothetical protein L914_15721 [Phytophthora nicotianae]ETP23431.1 hypothetical protein F441_03451 [Phytophthora nicotianae CJ01A1]